MDNVNNAQGPRGVGSVTLGIDTKCDDDARLSESASDPRGSDVVLLAGHGFVLDRTKALVVSSCL